MNLIKNSGEAMPDGGQLTIRSKLLEEDLLRLEAQEIIGLGETYLEKEHCSLFSLKNSYTFHQEVGEGDTLRITYRVLDCSPKLLHVLLEMHHADEGFLSCHTEQLVAHVNMDTRRTAPLPPSKLEMLEEMKSALSGLALPRGIGEPIGIKRG